MPNSTPTPVEAGALDLARAIVTSSPVPLLLLDGDLCIVAASASFSEAFSVDTKSAPGQPLASLGEGEWGLPKIRSLLTATLSGAADIKAYECELVRAGQPTRCLVLSAQRVAYLDLANTRVLLAVTDITEARANELLKDEALRRNLVLLQEVRHRVANSLQIIASVLLQNARKTPSKETRGHLTDAHQRVMSVAALERQLSGSGEQDVELQAYLTTLCESISASMIENPKHLVLSVTGSRGDVPAGVSISLGLIATELIINALKHAFVDGRSGAIKVNWTSEGSNWTMSVTDNGVGMPRAAGGRTGLGTSIVEALAKQLDAAIDISSAAPGTCVAITHPAIRLVSRPEQSSDFSAVERPAA